jgi:hypothetical protein
LAGRRLLKLQLQVRSFSPEVFNFLSDGLASRGDRHFHLRRSIKESVVSLRQQHSARGLVIDAVGIIDWSVSAGR